MLKSTHFGACSDAMQQVHGAGVKSNQLLLQFTLTPDFTYTYNDFGVNCNN